MSVDYRIIGSPVNQTAARVVSSGFGFKFDIKRTVANWEAPPATRAVQPGQRDLSGTSFGSMRVVGLLVPEHGKRKWLCRCNCGAYEPRSARAILNPKNSRDACYDCRTLHERKRHAVMKSFYDKHGCWPDQSGGAEARRICREWDR